MFAYHYILPQAGLETFPNSFSKDIIIKSDDIRMLNISDTWSQIAYSVDGHLKTFYAVSVGESNALCGIMQNYLNLNFCHEKDSISSPQMEWNCCRKKRILFGARNVHIKTIKPIVISIQQCWSVKIVLYIYYFRFYYFRAARVRIFFGERSVGGNAGLRPVKF